MSFMVSLRAVLALIAAVSLAVIFDVAQAQATTTSAEALDQSFSSSTATAVSETLPHGRAAAAIVIKSGTKKVLYQYQADMPHPAASLTKLANALVFVRRRVSLAKRVTLLSQDEVGGGRLRVALGARLTARDLVYCSITASANNTANAMARVAGVSRAKYVQLMNEEARRVGARQSVFVDPSGMSPGNMTTARDMALIAEKAFREEDIRRAASTDKYTFAVQEGKRIIRKTIRNTNDLLIKDPEVWVTGGKTGYLEEAQYNLVVRLRPLGADGRAIRSREVTVVVLGAPTKGDSFAAAKALAQWTWANKF